MKILVVVLVCFVIVGGGWILYHLLYVRKRSQEIAREKFRTFEKLIRKLSDNGALTQQELLPLASDPSTRHALFGILRRFERQELFPSDFYTIQHGAESFLVSWLEFPTELNATPEKIQLITKVNLPEEPELEYFVFKFKKGPSRYRFSDDWMLGVVGPFDSQSQPYDLPARVFSRFNVLGTVSPLQEAQWVHEHINKR